MLEFIDRLRQKPEHVRRRIAAGTAITITGLVTLGWMGALVAGNAFILTPSTDAPSLAETGSPLTEAVANRPENRQNLLGGVGAAGGGEESSLIIVEEEAKSTVAPVAPEERTSISF